MPRVVLRVVGAVGIVASVVLIGSLLWPPQPADDRQVAQHLVVGPVLLDDVDDVLDESLLALEVPRLTPPLLEPVVAVDEIGERMQRPYSGYGYRRKPRFL